MGAAGCLTLTVLLRRVCLRLFYLSVLTFCACAHDGHVNVVGNDLVITLWVYDRAGSDAEGFSQ